MTSRRSQSHTHTQKPPCYDFMVLGGGPTGLFAALSLAHARPDLRILILEAKDQMGGKIPASGNGRCNFTNRDIRPADYLSHSDGALISRVLAAQGVASCLDFWSELGLAWREEDERLYPASFEAKTVLGLLLRRASESGIEMVTGAMIDALDYDGSCWRAAGYRARSVLLAMGSPAGRPLKAYRLPQLPPLQWQPWEPGLSPIEVLRPFKSLSGTRLRGEIEASREGARLYSVQGEVLITAYGLSGIASQDLGTLLAAPDLRAPGEAAGEGALSSSKLDASGASIAELRRHALGPSHASRSRDFKEAIYGSGACAESPCLLEINFFPEWALDHWIREEERRVRGERGPIDVAGLLPEKMERLFTERLAPQLRKAGFTSREIFYLLLGAFPMLYKSPRSFEFSQVASGGLDLRAFRPESLEHREHRGLYAAGEILDVVGHCGGFNLQWCWSSARYVAMDLAQKL